MRRICFMVAICLTILFQSSAIGETELFFEGSDQNSVAYQKFTKSHPECIVNTETNIYRSTNEIISALLTGEFPYDTFVMTTTSFDIKKLMKKGYCANLSESPVIQKELEQMYEPIQQQLTYEGKLYGAPFYCYIGYYAYRPDAWEAAGLTQEDVPTSFTELLDFLEAWVERIIDEPEDDISVCNAFASEAYGEDSYISYLVDHLIQNYIMDYNYANKPLRFDTPLFRNLLERCEKIGADLYLYEPRVKGDFALFEDLYGMRELAHLIPLRMTNEQPVLIKASLYTGFLNARGQHQELATEYLEAVVTSIAPEMGAYLYRDAEPVENPDFRRAMDKLQAEIDDAEKKLATSTEMEPVERHTLQDQVDVMKREWEQMSMSEERYLVSENDLRLYRNYGDNLYFQAPSIFDPSTEDGQNMKQLRDRFCTGNLSADQFISRLDELAWTLEQEGNQ